MAKIRTQFLCRDCGGVQVRWAGRCPDCGAWDSLDEVRFAPPTGDEKKSVAAAIAEAPRAVPIGEVGDDDASQIARLSTGIGELDRVLGGAERGGRGLVPASVVLIGGDPGVGKSTLMLQAAHGLASRGGSVLYVSSEESARQVRLRFSRLHQDEKKSPERLYVLSDTNLSRIIEQVRQVQPDVVVVDSVQMVYRHDLTAAPGSVGQLRACCQELVAMAKSTGTVVLLVGHVTKEGRLAGPRLLEHMVDAVLYFEGDRYHHHRVVRGIKNRFGTTLEVGLFEMGESGLAEVRDGAGLLAAEYQASPGSVVCPVLQGTRCLLLEIQALTATGFLGAAKRKTSGLDPSRLAMLIAVLEKRGELRLADQDVYASSAGGIKVAEPAADLAIALAVAGAHYNRSLDPGVCAVGEISLSGHIRPVQQMTQRLKDASRLGFKQVLCAPGAPAVKGCQMIPVKRLDDALGVLHG